MSGNEFFYPLVAATVAIALRYVNKSTGKNVYADLAGKYRLRMHRLYQITGYIAIAVCALLIAGPFFMDDMDLAAYLIFFCCYLIFGGLGMLCILYYKNHHVIFDDTTIEVRDAFLRVKFMEWRDIDSGSYNPITGLITFSDKAGNKIKLNHHLVGLAKFITMLEQKTAWTAERLRLPVAK